MKIALLGSAVLLSACSALGSDVHRGSTQEAGPPSTAAAAPVPEQPPASNKRLAFYLGQRNLDEDYWDPLDQQVSFGFEFIGENAANWVGFEVGLMGSYNEDTEGAIDVDGSTAELYVGIHKTLGKGSVHPYLGGGVSWIAAEYNGSVSGLSVSDDDSSVAGYAHGGIVFDLSRVLSLGVDLRTLFGSDITLFGANGDADYVQLAVVMGVRI